MRSSRRPRRFDRRYLFTALIVLIGTAALLFHFRSTDTRPTPVPPDARAALPSIDGRLPRPPRHVVIVVEENKSFEQIVGNAREAPYLNTLAHEGALFTRSYGLAHPSQPNYVALLAGRLNENGDACDLSDVPPDAPNLAAALFAAGRTFAGYAESLPQPGFRDCAAGLYVRRHAPWAHFDNVPPASIQPFRALPAYDRLPTVAFVIPNLDNDMHSASIARGDAWLRAHLGPLIAAARRTDTLVVITFDESSAAVDNHIATLFVGPMVKPGRYDEVITHFRVLRTLTDLFRLTPIGETLTVSPIVDCWIGS